jgi:hypothetical protein
MRSAAIIQFQKKQEARFLCSACGADRGCDCNAPAVEKLAELKEKHRIAARESARRKREKNQSPVDVNGGPIEEPCPDCDTPEDFWRRGLSNMAGDAIAMRSYWSRQYGGWQSYKVTSELVTLARQAADAWTELANFLEGKSNGKET